GQALAQLLREHVVSRTVVSLCERFPDAEDRTEFVSERRSDFLLDAVALFGKEGAPFRMPQNHIATTEVFQHRCGDFSRISAALLPKHILGPELNWGRRAQDGADRFQCGEWGSNDQFDG